jgi:glycosyltransferase involved in cell wall biosynthesis
MRKLLFLVSEDWFFVSHFLPMARAAKAAGFEVAVATRVTAHGGRIASEGCRLIPFEMERGSIAPLAVLRGMLRVWRIVRDEKPDLVHCIALRMILLGGIPAKLAGAKALVLAPTGLGHLWTSNGPLERLMRWGARLIVGRFLRGPGTHYLFENADDPAEFGLSATDPAVTIVPGAGVDPAEFPKVPEPPSPPVRIALVSRMLRSKGVAEAVEAVRAARRLGAPVELDLYGRLDQPNPASIPEAELRQWSTEPGIMWHGVTADVPAVWREHHIALFLSYYREGLPRALTEAAASGRPIVTTDAIGCREVVRDGVEGFLVPVGDTQAAAQALVKLAGDPALRARLGDAAHERFQERLTEDAVRSAVTKLYRSALPADGLP